MRLRDRPAAFAGERLRYEGRARPPGSASKNDAYTAKAFLDFGVDCLLCLRFCDARPIVPNRFFRQLLTDVAVCVSGYAAPSQSDVPKRSRLYRHLGAHASVSGHNRKFQSVCPPSIHDAEARCTLLSPAPSAFRDRVARFLAGASGIGSSLCYIPSMTRYLRRCNHRLNKDAAFLTSERPSIYSVLMCFSWTAFYQRTGNTGWAAK